MLKKNISQAIIDKNIELQKLIHAQTVDPDIISNESNTVNILTSVKANQIHDKYEFETDYTGLYIIPYLESEFEYDGAKHTVKIFCKPRKHRLIYRMIKYSSPAGPKETILSFTKINIKIKSANLKESFFKASKKEILKYIAAHPAAKLDKTHLDPQMERMLSFT